ncbi:hypothetical protein GALMADRAFT_230148 [Galerina marginata CBS 339.88]|uniref:Uncharacterized protein n=1 Tax=Galerina marginata (strain CBS 339.88) TaxID=685588 RepID=A0A067SJF4_GALM3|nr:hypothetical protein GALMADRAFT_230148 [Galerina marginata CBS 339.88]
MRATSVQSQSQSLRQSCDIYYQHIGVKRRGSPLWIPEPNKKLPVSYRRMGNTIGDVGIITDSGGFDFLFNICLPLGHPNNPSRLPENFVPFHVESADIREYSAFNGESYFSSASVKRSQHGGGTSGLNFEASASKEASEGAILTMPVGLNSEDLGNIFWIRQYADANAEHWYRYINQVRGREVKNGDVRVVVGHDKTTAWGIATFSNLTAQTDSFHLKFRPVEQCTVGRIYEWEYSGTAEVRSGPHALEIAALQLGDPEQQGAGYENQCLFVRTLNFKVRDDIWEKLESELAELAVKDAPGYSYSDLLPSSQLPPASTTTHPSQSTTSGGGHSQFQHLPNLPTALVCQSYSCCERSQVCGFVDL